LLLPNAWDAMSARQFEAAGFGAIATTSGGLAWALGFPDGERAPWQEVVAATARINGANRLNIAFRRVPGSHQVRRRAAE
jgi:2-methylisocitrate lyase-like PEP mutase family enzyme